jgi:hypothetical protein
MSDNEPRELTPVQMFWDNTNGVRDFRPHIQKVEPEEEVVVVRVEGPTDEEMREAEEVEKALTPAPKDSPAQGSVPSQESAASIAPSELETPVLPASTPPMPSQVTPQQSDADSESGKPSESSEAVPPPTTPPTPAPATSSPASSSATSRGKSTPPAVAKPPTSA